MLNWKIRYGDGSAFSSEDGEPHEAPPHNVMVVSQKDERVGTAVLNQWDWYVYSDDLGGWCGVDVFGVLDQIMHNCDKIKAVIQGRVAGDTDFQAILKKARNDPDMPRKSADGHWEKRGPKGGKGSNQ